MTRDSGLMSQHTADPQAIQELLDQLSQRPQTPQLAPPPDALEALERDIRHHTDRLGSLFVGHPLQASLDSEALQGAQDLLGSHWPKPLQNDGQVTVWVRTAQGMAVPVRVTDDRRQGTRRAGKRYAGVYAGLVLLGVYDRCTPTLAAEGSLLAARLGSLDEARDG